MFKAVKTSRMYIMSFSAPLLCTLLANAEAFAIDASRRGFLETAAASVVATGVGLVQKPSSAFAESQDIEDYLKTGMVSMPMGVSGQAGKSKPQTGVVLREGSEVSRDARSGGVLAEILLGKTSDPTPVLASFSSPWSLAKGGLFDVECRDASTGDGAFLTVAGPAKRQAVTDLPKNFFIENLFRPTGRFSFYGVPTDIKVKQSYSEGAYRYLEISFSNLSQSTNAEIPRNAIVAATIPEGTDDVVMLVGSATANRWRKGSDESVRKAVSSFRATLAPKTSLKIRAKESRSEI